jgi:hypothetical protein
MRRLLEVPSQKLSDSKRLAIQHKPTSTENFHNKFESPTKALCNGFRSMTQKVDLSHRMRFTRFTASWGVSFSRIPHQCSTHEGEAQ